MSDSAVSETGPVADLVQAALRLERLAVSPLLRATRCAPPPETRGARARPTVAVSPEQAVLL